MNIFPCFLNYFPQKILLTKKSQCCIIQTVIKMVIKYDEKKLSDVLKDFYHATGVNMSIVNADFEGIARLDSSTKNEYCKNIQSSKNGNSMCWQSDLKLFDKCKKSRKTEMHICHAGLVDIAVPIIHENDIIGYLILGGLKSSENFSDLESMLDGTDVDINSLRKCYSQIMEYDGEKIKSVANIATILAKHILINNMIFRSYSGGFDSVVDFINNNLSENLSVKTICEKTNVSKSVIYKNFRKDFDCTLTEYINKKRIEKAVEFLCREDCSVAEAAEKSGYMNIEYFCKVFKKQKGMSPLKFKKENLSYKR